jgi:hypothetical protein
MISQSPGGLKRQTVRAFSGLMIVGAVGGSALAAGTVAIRTKNCNNATTCNASCAAGEIALSAGVSVGVGGPLSFSIEPSNRADSTGWDGRAANVMASTPPPAFRYKSIRLTCFHP